MRSVANYYPSENRDLDRDAGRPKITGTALATPGSLCTLTGIMPGETPGGYYIWTVNGRVQAHYQGNVLKLVMPHPHGVNRIVHAQCQYVSVNTLRSDVADYVIEYAEDT